MELKKCPRCGRFHNSEELACQNCMPKEREELKRVIEYMDEGSLNYCLLDKGDENYNSIFVDISKNTGVSQPKLERYFSTYLQDQTQFLKDNK